MAQGIGFAIRLFLSNWWAHIDCAAVTRGFGQGLPRRRISAGCWSRNNRLNAGDREEAGRRHFLDAAHPSASVLGWSAYEVPLWTLYSRRTDGSGGFCEATDFLSYRYAAVLRPGVCGLCRRNVRLNLENSSGALEQFLKIEGQAWGRSNRRSRVGRLSSNSRRNGSLLRL